jgi:hypothetical protein
MITRSSATSSPEPKHEDVELFNTLRRRIPERFILRVVKFLVRMLLAIANAASLLYQCKVAQNIVAGFFFSVEAPDADSHPHLD